MNNSNNTAENIPANTGPTSGGKNLPFALGLAVATFAGEVGAATCGYDFSEPSVVAGADGPGHQAWPSKGPEGLMFTDVSDGDFSQRYLLDGESTSTPVRINGVPSEDLYMAQFTGDSILLREVERTVLYEIVDGSGGNWEVADGFLADGTNPLRGGGYSYDQISQEFIYAPYDTSTNTFNIVDESGNLLASNGYEPASDASGGRVFFVRDCDGTGMTGCQLWVYDERSGCQELVEEEARSPYFDQENLTLYFARNDGGPDGYDIVSVTEGDIVETPVDSDGDGVPDGEDAFPNNANETKDRDGDGVGDNSDAYPDDKEYSEELPTAQEGDTFEEGESFTLGGAKVTIIEGTDFYIKNGELVLGGEGSLTCSDAKELPIRTVLNGGYFEMSGNGGLTLGTLYPGGTPPPSTGAESCDGKLTTYINLTSEGSHVEGSIDGESFSPIEGPGEFSFCDTSTGDTADKPEAEQPDPEDDPDGLGCESSGRFGTYSPIESVVLVGFAAAIAMARRKEEEENKKQ